MQLNNSPLSGRARKAFDGDAFGLLTSIAVAICFCVLIAISTNPSPRTNSEPLLTPEEGSRASLNTEIQFAAAFHQIGEVQARSWITGE